MATTKPLMEYLTGKECQGFEARPHYFEDGDYVTYFASDQIAYEERIDELLTIYRSMETHNLLGCKIKGVRRILETLGNFGVIVGSERLLMGMFFIGAALNRPEKKDEYEKYGKEYGKVPVDPNELPISKKAA